MNEQLTENNEIFNINPKNVLKILFSSNCRHLHNFLCAVILFGAFFSFLVLTLFIDSYRRFEVSDIETCEILEIPPFTQPQSGIYCCSVEVNPLVLMVTSFFFSKSFNLFLKRFLFWMNKYWPFLLKIQYVHVLKAIINFLWKSFKYL